METLDQPIRLGVSSCLLGEPVRYDGGHKLDHFVRDTLGRFVEFVPVCPETEAGFGVPRESMRLVGDPASPRLTTTRTSRDLTDRMRAWIDKRVEELAAEDLCGFIFKSKSPSSGLARVKVYPEGGGLPSHAGVGLFAQAFMERFPLLPVEDEGRLHDPGLRENFIERVFVMRRWRDLRAKGQTLAGLIDFHSRHKYMLTAHSPALEKELGKLVADGAKADKAELFGRYERLLMTALAHKATVAKNYNVLHKLLGYFKKDLTGGEKRELIEVFDSYKSGFVPLIVPVTLVKHYVGKYDKDYLKGQHFLEPHPLELRLRNHA